MKLIKIVLYGLLFLTGSALSARGEEQEPYINLESNYAKFDAYSGNYYSLTVYANVDWTATVSDADWLRLSRSSGSADTLQVIMTADNSNESLTARAGSITFTSADSIGITKKVTVIQSGQKGVCLYADANSASVSFSTSGDWTAASSDDWLTLNTEQGSDDGIITLSATANTGSVMRTATLTVTKNGYDIYSVPVIQVSDTAIELTNDNIEDFWEEFSPESENYPNKANYILTENITTPWQLFLGYGGGTWAGSMTAWGLAGCFDGNGYSVIINMNKEYLSAHGKCYQGSSGMFAVIQSAGTLRKLRIKGTADLWGGYGVSMVTTENSGLMEQIIFDADAARVSQWGGVLCVENYGTIKDCYCGGNITGYGCSYNSAVISGGGTVKNCIATGLLTDVVGGLLYTSNDNCSGLFENSDSLAGCSSETEDDCTVSYSTLALQDNYTMYREAGWDISDSVYSNSVWYMADGEDYPRLRWEMTGPVYLSSTEGGSAIQEPSRAGLYLKGQQITLTATYLFGYSFVGYYTGDSLISSDEVIDLYVNDSLDIIAVFEENPYLTVSANELSCADSALSTASFGISSNSDWTISCSADWLSISTEKGSNDTTIVLTANANTSLSGRTAEIIVSGAGTTETITLTQSASEPFLTVSVTDIELSSEAGSTSTLLILTNTEYSISCSAGWITYSQNTDSDTTILTVTANTANLNTNERNTTLTVSIDGGETCSVTVTQQAGSTTSAAASAQKDQFLLYPNPAAEYVQLITNKTIQKIVIYDCLGSVKARYKAAESYYVGNLPNGIYFIVCKTTAGTITKRLTIK